MNWTVAHFELVGVMVAGLLIAVIVLQQRRSPQSTAAWLLFAILVPYLALPLFLALGFRKLGRPFQRIAFSDDPPDDADLPATSSARVLRSLGVPGAAGGHAFRLVDTPDGAYRELMALVESAEHSIDAEFYILADDPPGRDFVAALERRAREGVTVRLLLDRFGCLSLPRSAVRRLEAAGGEVRFFASILRRAKGSHLNLRNHRKAVIADGRRVFSGGMNVGVDYMSARPGAESWTDLAYMLEGAAATTFEDVFRSDWRVAGGVTGPSPRPAGNAEVPAGSALVQLVPSGPDLPTDPLHDALLHAIHVATDRVWIATPYFLPTEELSSALALTARRGVDVRILVPWSSNQRIADFARGAYLRTLQNEGCTLLMYRRGMFHAKAGVIDGEAFVGSANFDVRSMLLNFETTIFVYDRASVRALATWFEAREAESTSGLPPAALPRRFAEGLFRLGAPVL